MITHCPACGALIVVNGVTKGHETYADCLEALLTDLFVIVKKIIKVVRLVIKDNAAMKAEVLKVYDGKLEV